MAKSKTQRAIGLAAILAGGLALAACAGVRANDAGSASGGSVVAAAKAQLTPAEMQRRVHGLVVTSDGRDPYLSARDPGTGEFVRDVATGELFYTPAAVPSPWWVQHLVVSSDGRDPYLSARDPGTGELILDIATGEPLR